MLTRWWHSLLAVVLFATPLAAQSESAATTSGSQNQTQAGSAVAAAKPQSKATGSPFRVPAETTIPVELRNTINTRNAFAGEAVYCDTIYPITVSNRIVIPAGSWVKGEVTQVVRPGHVKGRAQIGLRFISITLPNGTTRSLRATLSGFGGTGKEGFNKRESKVEGQSSKGGDAGKVAQTTITGAEIGTIAGAAGHDVGKGLGIGSAAGAAGGLIWALAARGKDIVLPSGTSLELQLAAPLNFEDDELDSARDNPAPPAIPPRDPGPGK